MSMAVAGGDLTTTVVTTPTDNILVTPIRVIIIATTGTTTIDDSESAAYSPAPVDQVESSTTQHARHRLDVRFTPESGHFRKQFECLLWAKSGNCAASILRSHGHSGRPASMSNFRSRPASSG